MLYCSTQKIKTPQVIPTIAGSGNRNQVTKQSTLEQPFTMILTRTNAASKETPYIKLRVNSSQGSTLSFESLTELTAPHYLLPKSSQMHRTTIQQDRLQNKCSSNSVLLIEVNSQTITTRCIKKRKNLIEASKKERQIWLVLDFTESS